MSSFYVGVDVGTGSARAGIFDGTGRMLGQASREIRLWRPEPDFAEQSSDDIWAACCAAVKEALAEAAIAPERCAASASTDMLAGGAGCRKTGRSR